jgi:hypothetical protein
MTKEEKKMKSYMTAIERRLNLPREVRARVMTDLQSSVAARREAGQTDEEIYAELGTPEAVAAELNEQMKEYAYAKSSWRWAALAAAGISAAMLVFHGAQGLLVSLLNLSVREQNSLGIIGGADGPTAIFVTTTWTPADMIPWLILLIMGLIGWRMLSRMKRS